MKKILFLFNALWLMIAALLVSCTKTGVDDGSGDGPEKEKVTCKVTYTLSPEVIGTTSFDNHLFCDINVSYRKSDGTMSEAEKIESLPWSVTVENVEPPFKAEMKMTYTLKDRESVVSDKQSFNISNLRASSISYTTSEGGFDFSGTSDVTVVRGIDKAYEYVKTMIEKYPDYTRTLDIP